jgi:hypothetical protein
MPQFAGQELDGIAGGQRLRSLAMWNQRYPACHNPSRNAGPALAARRCIATRNRLLTVTNSPILGEFPL